jgi:hypothetical protein
MKKSNTSDSFDDYFLKSSLWYDHVESSLNNINNVMRMEERSTTSVHVRCRKFRKAEFAFHNLKSLIKKRRRFEKCLF